MRLDEGQGPNSACPNPELGRRTKDSDRDLGAICDRKATDTVTPTDRFRRCEKLPVPRSPTIEGCQSSLADRSAHFPEMEKNPVSKNCWRFAFRRYEI